ncbi:MAG: YceI family protein [Verrucomicrobiales bacterium]|nr:YceI family protein [Verrucomicrobiales bacterium]
MNASDLNTQLSGPRPPLLVHVNTEEHFAARRISGAKNVCVYETAFLDNLQKLEPEKTVAIIVYGEGAPSLDSEEAAHRLITAGYTNVTDFRGGLREWEQAGLPILSDTELPQTPVITGQFKADTQGSLIRWTGRNLFNHHSGSLKLAAGHLTIEKGALKTASFILDMNSITCEDLTDSGYNAMLIHHLRTTDFFDVDQYPTATFEATRADAIEGSTDGTPNYQITGGFSLRGITHEITFPAVVAIGDAKYITAQAQIEIDRTRWGSRYGSGKFFAFLGKHVVNDHIQLHLKIHAERG